MRNVAHYVLSLSGAARTIPRARSSARSKFAACAACHGADGKGNPALGAPNLTDDVWLHGWGEQAIISMVDGGKTNQMPATGRQADRGADPRAGRLRLGPVAAARRRPQAPRTRAKGPRDVRAVTARSMVIPIAAAAAAKPAKGARCTRSQKKIYPRAVTAGSPRWRWALVWLTQLVFYGLPWLQWNGRQAVLFDLAARRFYIFGLVLYPQDFIYLTGLLVISALSLFLFTAVAGAPVVRLRLPADGLHRDLPVDRAQDRGRPQRAHEARQRAHVGGQARQQGLKQALWIALALWTGFTFVGYFTPIRDAGPSRSR